MVESSETAQSVYREVAAASGVEVDQLLARPAPHVGAVVLRSLRQMAAMLSIAKILEADFGRAQVYGGISLGELAALHMAGAASVEMVVDLLRVRHLPDTSLDEAICFTFVPTLDDWRYYDDVDSMSVSVDYGPVFDGTGRMIMLSGLRSTLESMRTAGPAELQVVDRDMADQAYHSPFREPGRRRLSSFLVENPLSDPMAPVLTAVPGLQKASTGGKATEALLKSETHPLSVPVLVEGVEKFGLDKVHAVSSFLGELRIRFGAPTDYYGDRWLAYRFG